MTTHRYFVAFTARGITCANTQVNLAQPIRGMADIKVVTEALEQAVGVSEGVVVTHWQRFED